MTPTRLILFAIAAMFLTSCAGLSGGEVLTATATGAGALVGFIEALAPMLTPEQQAMLSATATNVESTVQATTNAVSQIASAIAELRAQQQSIEATEWTGGEVAATGTALTGAAVAASRLLSRMKHGGPPATTPPMG